jgi:hypothetical protein
VEDQLGLFDFVRSVGHKHFEAIALHFYKDANKYPRIFEANREVTKDPNLIFPGQEIRIPPALKVASADCNGDSHRLRRA